MKKAQLYFVSFLVCEAISLSAARAFADEQVTVVPSAAQCAINIHPNGSILYDANAAPNTFCLSDDPDSLASWGQDRDAIKVSRRTVTGALERLAYAVGPNKKPIEPAQTYPIPFDKAEVMHLVIQARPDLADPAALEKLKQAVKADKDLANAVDAILRAQPSTDKAEDLIDSDLKTVSADDWWPMFNGPLPKFDASLKPLLWLDATSNTSTDAGKYRDGAVVRGWAYDLGCTSDQAIDFAKVSAISSTSPLVSLIASVVAANPAKAFTPFGLLAAPAGPAVHVSPTNAAAIMALVVTNWRKHMADVPRLRRCTTALKTTVLDGGFNYIFEAVTPAITEGVAKQPAQVTGAKEFKTYARHRIVGLAAELAFGKSENGFPDSGYGYQAIAQSGPDQLYQLQELNHFQDTITSSALLLWYPVPTFGSGRGCANDSTQLLCTDGLALGFGPTLLRGGSGEFAKQWNTRIGWEIVPNILLLTGLSWRSIDVPNLPNASLGSTVAVSRPASTPSPGTEPRTDLLWSVGIAVDLNIIANAVTAVSKAVTTSGNGAN